MLTRPTIRRDALATVLMVALAGVYSHLSPGRSLAAESIAIDLPDFEPVKRECVVSRVPPTLPDSERAASVILTA